MASGCGGTAPTVKTTKVVSNGASDGKNGEKKSTQQWQQQ